ncbi:MAG TPA: YqaJ viral recombinase family protein [Clostridia bacterium]|nr:YqaJ viral recombinase family protein [Clostridia bacterium]
MPKWITRDQRNNEWSQARLGCLTASRFADAIALTKKGDDTEARRKYKLQLVAERLSGCAADFHITDAMQRGIEMEYAARQSFEAVTGLLVEECGFALHDTIEHCGASPDGLIGDDGILEIKCPTTARHLEYLIAGTVPVQHVPQMNLQLMVTGRKYGWFVSYDDRLPPPYDMFMARYEPTGSELLECETQARDFLTEVDLLVNHIKRSYENGY